MAVEVDGPGGSAQAVPEWRPLGQLLTDKEIVPAILKVEWGVSAAPALLMKPLPALYLGPNRLPEFLLPTAVPAVAVDQQGQGAEQACREELAVFPVREHGIDREIPRAALDW
jgi:hypothetical protein